MKAGATYHNVVVGLDIKYMVVYSGNIGCTLDKSCPAVGWSIVAPCKVHLLQ